MQVISRHCASARLTGPSARRNPATSRPRFCILAAAEAATADSRAPEAAELDIAAAAAEAEAADNVKKAKVAFKVPHHVEYGQEMCLVGGVTALGAWSTEQCVPMAWTDGDVWTAEAAVPAGTRVEYKYIVRAATSGEVVEWQPCDNLELAVPPELVEAEEEPLVVVQDSWEGEQHSVKVGDTELAPPPVLEAPAEDEEGALAAAAATAAVSVESADSSSDVDTTPTATATQEDGTALYTMEHLAAAVTDDIPIKGVEAAAASTNGTGKKVPAPEEVVLETLAAVAVAAGKGAALDKKEEEEEEEDDGLEELTMNELKAVAKKAGINTFAAKRKDLITRVRAKRAASSTAAE